MVSTAIIKIMEGNYVNLNAYECVIHYIKQKKYCGGYGFLLPNDTDSIASSFRKYEDQSVLTVERPIWHFAISMPDIKSVTEYLLLGQAVASTFSDHYQVIYSLDISTSHPHLHFGINAYSYYPHIAPLSRKILELKLDSVAIYINTHYPCHKIIPEYRKKGDS